jgi:hypothetical protein
MTGISDDTPIDDVAPGDLIWLNVSTDESAAEREYKVVFIDPRTSADGSTFNVTVELDDGETFDVDLPGGAIVKRSMESKWESAQSPTANDD